MKLVRWLRFSWDLAKLPAPPFAMEPHYQIRAATRDEADTVLHVVMSAFSLDAAWADTLNTIREWLEAQIEESLSRKGAGCLVITHGARIIGASALDMKPEAESHLLTGPCVLSEYCSRGFGSALLYQSLLVLRDAGLSQAHAIAKGNVPVAKFIYPKFNSVSAPVDFDPVMVGS